MEPTGTPEIITNHEKNKQMVSKSKGHFNPVPQETFENIGFWEALGPAESYRDSGESVVFTNSPNHEKIFKVDSKSIDFGGPGDVKITKNVEN